MVTECKDDPARNQNLETIMAVCERVDEKSQFLQAYRRAEKSRVSTVKRRMRGSQGRTIGSTARRKRTCSGQIRVSRRPSGM